MDQERRRTIRFNRLRRTALGALFVMSAALMPMQTSAAQKTAVVTFGSGCFWCTESDFDKVPGVLKTVSGFMGGHTKNPTYRQVVGGGTGHTEVVQITYDPAKVSFAKLLKVYWRNVDPFDNKGQFCDRGASYRPAIFAHTDSQLRAAKASKKALNDSGKFSRPVVVEIGRAGAFTAASKKHQNFHQKHPAYYYRYRIGCGRDRRLQQIWGAKAKS